MSFGTTYSPAVHVGGAASYKLWPVFTYSNGTGKCTDVFRLFLVGGGRVEGSGYMGGSLHEGTSHGGRDL